MKKSKELTGNIFIIERADFDALLASLIQHKYQLIGPTVRNATIELCEIGGTNDLPVGWTDAQNEGTYSLEKRNDKALFGFASGQHSWKQFLHLPTVRLWKTNANGLSTESAEEEHPDRSVAFIGARSCDLHAISIQDKIFLDSLYADRSYKLRRRDVFIVAVNCTKPGGTCFCSSMKTGPKATSSFDLALTEIINDHQHFFVTEVGTERGKEILNEIPHHAASREQVASMEELIAGASRTMGRLLNTDNIKNMLYRNYEHPRWNDVAARCLSCANCTMVCPTCFCTTIEDDTSLQGDNAERRRKWDSCFTLDFSYIHGGSVRSSVKSRYRQWLIHKLAAWIDQFGVSGCVGCGRCITWCPVGIDITKEANAIRASEKISSTT